MKIGIIGILLVSLIALPSAWSSAQHPSDGSSDDEMPDWTENVSIGDHYIIITQDETDPNQVTVEELIWFKNEGNANFAGHIFLWSQPQSMLTKINQFGSIVDETYTPAKVYPSTYSPNFLFANLSSENMTIEPSQTLELVFKYTLKYDDIKDATFHKTFLYDNSNIVLFIELNDDLKAEGKENVEIIFDEPSGKYVTKHSADSSKAIGEFITISFAANDNINNDKNKNGDDKEGEDTDYIIYIILVLVVAVVVTVLLKLKKKK
jgi:hypothetical protein